MVQYYLMIPIILIGSTIIAVLAALYTWRRGTRSSQMYMTLLLVMLAHWTLFYFIEIVLQDPSVMFMIMKIEYIGIAMIPVLWLLVALGYDRRENILARKEILMALMVIPVLTIVLVSTNEHHGLVWASSRLVEIGQFTIWSNTYNIWFWVFTIYSYFLLFLGSVIILRRVVWEKAIFRAQGMTLIGGVLFPWIGNMLFILDVVPTGAVDPTPVLFTISGVAISWALTRYKLFDLAPIARDVVMDRMSDALLVCDIRGRVVDLNPSAEEMFGISAPERLGSEAEDIIPEWNRLLDRLEAEEETSIEVTTRGRDGMMDLHVKASQLRERGEVTGYVVQIHDLSDIKRAERALRKSHENMRIRLETMDEDLAEAIMELSREVESRRSTEEKLKRRLEYERALSVISHVFVTHEDIDSAIDEALEEMGNVRGADRAFLFRYDEERTAMGITNQWCARGVEPLGEEYEAIPLDRYPWLIENLREGEVLSFTRITDIPSEELRRTLEGLGVLSVIVHPILLEGRVVGLLGLDNTTYEVEWNRDDKNLLRVASEIIGMALERKRSAILEREKARGEMYGLLTSAVPVFAANVPPQAREVLISTFADRFERNMRPQFNRDLRRLKEAQKDAALQGEVPHPVDVFEIYIAWLSEFFYNLGIGVRSDSEGKRNILSLLDCPWSEDAPTNPIFCLICRTVIYRSFIWTGLDGRPHHDSSIANGAERCRFIFIPMDKVWHYSND